MQESKQERGFSVVSMVTAPILNMQKEVRGDEGQGGSFGTATLPFSAEQVLLSALRT